MERESKGRGYVGHQMSVNAAIAYSSGEMPMSKWTKRAILKAIKDIEEETGEDLPDIDFSKLTLAELKDNFLEWTCWHHTGQFYTETDFYKLDIETVLNFSKEKMTEIILKRPARKKAVAKVEKATVNPEEIDGIYNKLEIIHISRTLKLKTFEGVVNRYLNGKLDINSVYNDALQAIKNKDEDKINKWRRLPDGHWCREYVKLFDNDLNAYAFKSYAEKKVNRRTKIYRELKKFIQE